MAACDIKLQLLVSSLQSELLTCHIASAVPLFEPSQHLQRRVALRSAPVTCATAVAHSLMQRLRPRERSNYSWITKKRRTRGLSHHPWT